MNISLLREYLRLCLESAPSRLAIRSRELSADSTGYETSHLDQVPNNPEPNAEKQLMAPHLEWGDAMDPDVESEDLGPVPPLGMDPRALPDPFVRGQYDNVTWTR